MGYSQKRTGKNGKPRYTAVYQDIRGIRHSAGTFAKKDDADEAWQTAEVRAREGRAVDPKRGHQKFRQYVEDEWFPNHRLELRAPGRTTPITSTATSSTGSAPCG